MILVGLCGVGLAIVAFDRLQSSGNPVLQAQAASASVVMSDGAGAEIPAVVPAPPERQSTTIARELVRIGGQREPAIANMRDVFLPGEPWAAPIASQPKPAAVEVDPARVDEFLRKHKLQAIVSIDGNWQALIDSQNFTVGDTCWEGFKVVAIDSQAVTLACGAAKVTMELAK